MYQSLFPIPYSLFPNKKSPNYQKAGEIKLLNLNYQIINQAPINQSLQQPY
jgi:hypothetical protein